MNRRRQPKSGRTRERRISVRTVRREQIDIAKLSRALITLAQAEAAAQADHEAGTAQLSEVANDDSEAGGRS